MCGVDARCRTAEHVCTENWCVSPHLGNGYPGMCICTVRRAARHGGLRRESTTANSPPQGRAVAWDAIAMKAYTRQPSHHQAGRAAHGRTQLPGIPCNHHTHAHNMSNCVPDKRHAYTICTRCPGAHQHVPIRLHTRAYITRDARHPQQAAATCDTRPSCQRRHACIGHGRKINANRSLLRRRRSGPRTPRVHAIKDSTSSPPHGQRRGRYRRSPAPIATNVPGNAQLHPLHCTPLPRANRALRICQTATETPGQKKGRHGT